MRLSKKTIEAVIEHKLPDGTTYQFYVICKGGISENRLFVNRDTNGRTVAEPYSWTRLPKSAQRFMESHTQEERIYEDSGFISVIYK